MKTFILMLSMLVSSVAFTAEETPLPKATGPIISELNGARSKAAAEAIKKLQKVQADLTKKSDLEGAMAVKKYIDKLAGESNNIESGNKTNINIESLLLEKKWKFYWQGLNGESKVMKFGKKGVITEGSNFGESSYKIKDGILFLINQNDGNQCSLTINSEGQFESGDTSDVVWKGKCFLIPVER
jgi:hypothetical protein